MFEKPVVKLTNTDGNAFAIISAVTRELKKAGANADHVKSFTDAAFGAESYNELLSIVTEYVEVV